MKGSLLKTVVPIGAVTISVFAILILVLLNGSATSMQGVTNDTGGRIALFSLLIIGLLTLTVRQLNMQTPSVLPWVVGGLSLSVVFILWFLVYFGFDSLAWAAYGGLQVLRGRTPFADTDWILLAFECNFCQEWGEFQGPSMRYIDAWTLDAINSNLTNIVGFIFAFALTATLIWIMGISQTRGKILLSLVALGPAWLLLLDRGNLDALIIIFTVLGIWLVTKNPSLVNWFIFAFLIFIVGTFKFYPFVVGLVLIYALRTKHGWLVISSFLVASFSYVVFFWDDLLKIIRFNSQGNAVLWDFPAYGSLIVLDRLGVNRDHQNWLLLGYALLAVMIFASAWWGFQWARSLPEIDAKTTLLTLAGAPIFIATVVIGGFGYMYKGGFLLLIVPLLALGGNGGTSSSERYLLRTSLFALLLLAVGLTVAYSSLLATLATLIPSSLALGAGAFLLWRDFISTRAGGPTRNSRTSSNSLCK